MCTHTHTHWEGGNVWQFYTIFIAYFIIRNKTAKRLKRPRLLLRWGLMQSERRWREGWRRSTISGFYAYPVIHIYSSYFCIAQRRRRRRCRAQEAAS